MKKIAFVCSVLLGILALLLGLFLILQWKQYESDLSSDRSFLKPRFEVASIEINKLDETETAGIMRIKIKNPLPVALTLTNMNYSLYLAGEEMLDKSYPDPVFAGAHDSAFFEFPVTLQNQRLLSIRKKALKEKADSIEFELRATFHTNLPFGKHIAVDIKKKRPLFKIPEAELASTEMDSLSVKGATLVMHIHIKNLNSFPIDLASLKYKAEIGNNIHMDGNKAGVLHIPTQGETNLELPLRVQFGKAGKTILEILVHGDNLDYHLEQDFIISSQNKALNNCKVHIHKDGKVKSLIRFREKQKQKKEEDDVRNKADQKG